MKKIFINDREQHKWYAGETIGGIREKYNMIYLELIKFFMKHNGNQSTNE
jgi:hypothetical protein